MTADARLTMTPPSATSFAMPIAMLVGNDTTSIYKAEQQTEQKKKNEDEVRSYDEDARRGSRKTTDCACWYVTRHAALATIQEPLISRKGLLLVLSAG